MWPVLLVVAYCVLIVAASLLGAWAPIVVRLTHNRMQFVLSAVAGLMLGVALLHMMPEAALRFESPLAAAAWMLAGLLVMFFLIRVFDFHQHGVVESNGHAHDHESGHGDHHHHHHMKLSPSSRRLSWLGLTIGLSLHTALDGVALASSVASEASHRPGLAALGLGTFLAVLLHKPIDAMSITSVMKGAGWSLRSSLLVNAAFAMMCPLGAAAFVLGLSGLSADNAIMGAALAFSAGVFLCISLGDLLPELQFHSHDRLALSAALLVGVAIALAIELLPGHVHR